MSQFEIITNIDFGACTVTLFTDILNYNTKLMSLVNKYFGVLII